MVRSGRSSATFNPAFEEMASNTEGTRESVDFLRTRITRDVESGKNGGRVQTRFPPEPNGYLHIGHAKSICLNFGLAEEYGGVCSLRFDDTNPAAEEVEYVEAIQEDIRWLGFDWQERLFFASGYFEALYDFAVQLIERGKAYVCDLSLEETRAYRGTVTEAGKNSPHRERSVEENKDLFARMRAGEFPDGSRTLRAKIDMASPNMNLRDPVLYRISRVPHHRTGTEWCIYPLYDFAHGLSDAIEGVTHSICTLEFENHRALYDWFLENVDAPSHPQQIEFNRLNVSFTITSKRKLLRLVQEGHVDGWDDPRMPTLRGIRRRGYTSSAVRSFCHEVGVTKVPGTIDMVVLENTLREELNRTAERRMAVLRPLKVVITNWPEDKVDELEAVNNPGDEAAGTRRVPFTRELWIERDDFMEEAPRKYFRLAPGREVRLRYAYYVTCTEVVKDATGTITEVHCTYDPESRGGDSPDGRKVKGTIHWVSAQHALEAEVRLYDHLFATPDPGDVAGGQDFLANLNPASLEILSGCRLEPSLAETAPGAVLQFERLGYFCADPVTSKPGAPRFHRTVALRDSWAKIAKQLAQD